MIYDVIVIGGGSIGLSSAHELADRGANVLVLEKYAFLNQKGSSAGHSRQFRIPYPEDYMVKMAVDAIPTWDALQTKADGQLRDMVGTLWFGDPNVHSTEGNIGQAEKAMRREGVEYTTLKVQDIEKQFGFQGLPSDYSGLFQKQGASIDLSLTLNTLLRLNKGYKNVTLREHTDVTGIKEQNGIFTVHAPDGNFQAKKLVITPGPYINDILNLLGFEISVQYWEMSSAYFKKKSPTVQYPTWFVFQPPKDENGNQFYGFPGVTWDRPDYIRVAPDFVIKPLSSPSERTGVPNPKELAFTSQWVKDHMTGLDPTPQFTSTCLIALSNLADKELVLDFAPPNVPGAENIVIYGTGWAAKFIPLLGKIISQLIIDGSTTYNIKPFQLGYKYFRKTLR